MAQHEIKIWDSLPSNKVGVGVQAIGVCVVVINSYVVEIAVWVTLKTECDPCQTNNGAFKSNARLNNLALKLYKVFV